MAEWTPEATEYLHAYLRQVAVLARSHGDDADEIVGELREHVKREAEGEGMALVTLDVLRKTLATVGTPEQVTGADSAVWAPRELPRSNQTPVPGSLESMFKAKLWEVKHKKLTALGLILIFLFYFSQLSGCRILHG